MDEAAGQAGTAERGVLDARRARRVLAAAILGSSMAYLDATVVNVALPALQHGLGATVVELQWVADGYLLFLAALLLLGGMLGDLYGRRRVFAGGVALFAAASAWCGLAQSPGELIAARAVQGVGAALLMPASLALISAAYPPERRGRAFASWAGFSALATALGPLLAGWLIDTWSWRGVFFINVPAALAVLALVHRFVPESRGVQAARPDWSGAALATAGLGLLTWALIESGATGIGAPRVLAGLGVGAAVLALFVAVQRRRAEPMLPLGLFRSRTFAGVNLMTLFVYSALGGALFFVPMNLIQVQGFSATGAGAALLPFVLILAALSRWAGRAVDHVGARPPLVLGPAVCAGGYALFLLPGTDAGYWAGFFPAVAVLGLGMAITVAPLTATVMTAAPAERAGIASGISNAASRTAGLAGIAALGAVMAGAFAARLDPALAEAGLPEAARAAIAADRLSLAAAGIPAWLDADAAAAARDAVHAAFVGGFRVVMGLCAALVLTAGLIAAASVREVRHG